MLFEQPFKDLIGSTACRTLRSFIVIHLRSTGSEIYVPHAVLLFPACHAEASKNAASENCYVTPSHDTG